MHREDLSKLPLTTKDYEVNLHGGFAIDQLNGGQIYYGMLGCAAMRVDPCTSSKQVGQNRGLETEQSGCLPAQLGSFASPPVFAPIWCLVFRSTYPPA